jgi:hypothetical protein
MCTNRHARKPNKPSTQDADSDPESPAPRIKQHQAGEEEAAAHMAAGTFLPNQESV